MAKEAQRVAVIDVGSNSTRLLVADVADGRVTPVERRSTVTRLGRGVDLSGQLAAEAIEATCAAVDPYVATLQELGAEKVDAIATSAVRDATNGGAFVAELRERFALSARVLDGDEEARMTYVGATSEHSPEVPTLVIDIGGGSTELIVGEGREAEWHVSLQAGVGRHTERHLVHDPPTPVELELVPYDPQKIHGHVLELPSIQRMLSRLAATPLERRREIPGLHADRAPTIVAGVVTLVETMRAFDLERITVSEHDILYGAAIALSEST
jgi:exopolyphosphatase/guanosine-5'-triphosphate,3'-diphosphate pyrophosphatase